MNFTHLPHLNSHSNNLYYQSPSSLISVIPNNTTNAAATETEYVHSTIKEDIINYFNNPWLSYFKDYNGIDGARYFIYGVKINTGLLTDYRYIIVVTKKYYGNNIELFNINWVSFQTRTYTQEQDISSLINVIPSTENIKILQSYPLEIKEKYQDKYIYTCPNSPVQITLLRKSLYYGYPSLNYPNKGNIAAALETYNCIITFL